MKLTIWLSSLLIGLIRKLSGANITISGEEIPESPVLFVANHFTRFETLVVPYMLYERHGRVTRSLADDDIFVGIVGRFMRSVGALSNKNKDRDCIIVEELLSGKIDWIIYPEGFMVKNKHITFDMGEFCTHSPEYEGPIHTGAALMALKVKILQTRARIDSSERLKRFCDGMDIDSSKIDKTLDIKVVPVSITYYPIRPGKNRFLIWVDSIMKQRDTRFFEELEIEVNLLMDAHMNLRFGKAIGLDSYMDELSQNKKDIYDGEKVNAFIDSKRKILTNDIMRRVYSQIQIHFDHIFILSLVTMSTVKVCPSYLKALIYKNVRSLRLKKGYNLHKELQQELFKLILDENYEPFRSVIDIALKQHILYLDSDGEYLFDRSLLEKEYPFHKIRVKNTLQVILNEIKWQKPVVEMATANSQYSEQELKEDNFRHLRKREWEYFEKEYKTYLGEVPTEEDKGAPIVLFNEKNDVGVVFSHGYMSAPKEIRALAEYLFEKGINVYGLRLRGHGTDPEALKQVSAKDWETDFERAFTAMREVCSRVFIGGFSMGGLLALIHASQYKVDGVIALNSAMRLHDLRVAYVVPTLHFFNEMIAYLNTKGIKEWIDNSRTEQPGINYTKHPLSSVVQMEKVMSRAQSMLKKVTAPILIIQGDNDPVVKRESARLIYDTIRSKEKKLLLLPREKHSILSDEGNREVFEAVSHFIQTHL
ncbi:alpha/beta fold hydrolase [Sulfurovum sp. ST-21]|uniref:Alpha/beta fold hydrolase n=1 Tax=Sulfurovum indicum TaxID=2779528 RepID=A0A7M1S6F7_9BACT|nr:alpha/beta fold hydrolase [Sulfurovum indicum]QOR62744.1 alpha/beta fold hydrolase [Sulfurovum indicum]